MTYDGGTLQVDLSEATRFLNLLDPDATRFTFQTFDDDKSRKDAQLGKILNGSIDELVGQLSDLNRRGAGVSVAVNRTDLKGRQKDNVIGVRAIWQEDDNDWQGEFPLEPSIVVETSPRRFHRYWLIEDGDGFEEIFPLVMARMVSEFGSDPSATDINRAMRLPGFLHRKAEPHRVKITAGNGKRYSAQEIVNAFPPVDDDYYPEPETIGDNEFDAERIGSALAVLPPEDRLDWFRYGGAIHDASNGSDEGFQIWDEWSQQTTAGNYDAKEQRRCWTKDFPKRQGRRTTLATIFYDARQRGWIEYRLRKGAPVSRENLAGGFDLDPLFQDGLSPLADRTIVAVRKRFLEYGHDPSVAHWGGLRDIARVYELMATGHCPQKLFISSLPPGMGKTTVAIEATKALWADERFKGQGVVYFLSRLEEIKTLVALMGLDKDDFATLTSDETVNALGNPVPEKARVLFTTQQRLEAYAKDGAAFAEMRGLRYNGKTRAIRVWDEAILPSMTLTLDKDGLFRLLRDLRRADKGLADLVEEFAISLRGAKGSTVEMPDIDRHSHGLEDFRAIFDSPSDKDTAEALWYLSGRIVRIRRDNLSGATSLDYEDILPPDIAPMLILDASGGLRRTYGFWKEHRQGLEPLRSPQKSYAGLTIHHWDKGSGKSAHGLPKTVREIASAVASTIDQIPENEGVLVIHHKARPRDLDIVVEIRNRLRRRDRVRFCC